MSRVRTSLAGVKPIWRDPDPNAAWALAQRIWHEHGFALLNPDEVERRHGWAAGQEARNLAERCFGRRETG